MLSNFARLARKRLKRPILQPGDSTKSKTRQVLGLRSHCVRMLPKPGEDTSVWNRDRFTLWRRLMIHVHPSYKENVVSSHRVTGIVKARKTRENETLASRYVLHTQWDGGWYVL